MNNSPAPAAHLHQNVLYIGSSEELCPLFSGYQHCKPLHKNESMRDHYLLCTVQSGHGTFCDGSLSNPQNRYAMVKGDTFLVVPGKFSSYIADERDPWVYAWIGFSGRTAGKYLNSTDFLSSPVVHTGTELFDKIHALTEMTLSQFDSQLRFMYASSALWTILADLIRCSHQTSRNKPVNNYTESAIEIIRCRYHLPLNVSDIAASLNISREYFYTLFKKDTGKSPSQYLMNFRIEKACAMLQESDYPVYLIAQHTGFSDKAYFSRKFHEHIGMPPLAYRKYVRETSPDSTP